MTEDAPVRRRKPWGLSRAPGTAHGVAARARWRSAKRGERGTGGLVVSSAERGLRVGGKREMRRKIMMGCG